MSIAYLVGKFGSGLAPGTVPAPAPITGHAVIRYSTLLQLNTAPGQLIPVTPVRLPIVDGVLCSATGVPSTITPIAVQATDDPLLAQSGGVFAQIDLIFDGGSEPVQVILALPTDATVDIATAARAGGPGAVFVSGLTPAQLTELDAGLAAVAADRAAAFAAQVAAEAAAAEATAIVTGDLDPAATALVNAPASQLRVALDAQYRTSFTGTHAARPAASAVPVGSLYFATDTLEQYRSNGAAWSVVGSGGIELAYAEITAPFVSSTASAVDVPGLSVTWVAGERPACLEFSGLMACGSSTPLAWVRMILGANTMVGVAGTTAASNVSVHRAVRLAGLTPGTSYTAKVRLDLPGGTTGVSSGQVNAAATNPASLRVVTA